MEIDELKERLIEVWKKHQTVTNEPVEARRRVRR
jgi:hypothetical protein